MTVGPTAIQERLTGDKDFRKSLRFSIGMFLFLCAIVGIQVSVGASVTLLTLIPFAIIICYFAYTDPFKGVMSLICFASIEGMYRYLAYFAVWEYLLTPAFSLTVLVIFLVRGNLNVTAGRRMPMLIAYVIAVGIGVTAIFNPLGVGIFGSLATFLVWYFIPMMMYPVVYFLKKKPTDIYVFCQILIVVGVFVSLVQLLQYSQGKGWTEAHFPGIEKTLNTSVGFTDARGAQQSSFRPAATTTTGGGAGMWARLSVIAAFVLFAILDKKFLTRLWLLIFGTIGVLGVFMCGTRIFIVFVAADLLFCSLYYANTIRALQKSVLILLAGGLLIRLAFSVSENVTGGFVSERYEKLFADPVTAYQTQRGASIPHAILTASTYPLGIGYSRGTGTRGEFEPGLARFGPGIGDRESQFGAYVSDIGIPGLVAYLALVIGLIANGVKQARQMRFLGTRLMACMGPSLLSSALVIWFAAPIMQGYGIYWIGMAMTFSLAEAEFKERERRRKVWEAQKAPALASAPS